MKLMLYGHKLVQLMKTSLAALWFELLKGWKEIESSILFYLV